MYIINKVIFILLCIYKWLSVVHVLNVLLQRTRKYSVKDVLRFHRDGSVPHSLKKSERNAFFKYSRNFQLHGKYCIITFLLVCFSVELFAGININSLMTIP